MTVFGWCGKYSLATKVLTWQEAIKLFMNTKNSQENENPMEIMSIDEPEEIIDPTAMKSVSKAL